MSSALYTLNAMTEVRPLSMAPKPQLLPGCHRINHCSRCFTVFVCVRSLLTAVCVHLDGLNAEHKFRVWVTIPGHTSCPILSLNVLLLLTEE